MASSGISDSSPDSPVIFVFSRFDSRQSSEVIGRYGFLIMIALGFVSDNGWDLRRCLSRCVVVNLSVICDGL